MTELDRLWRSNRRAIIVWLCVTGIMLVYCLFGAFTYQPTLWYSWKGPVLLLLSVGYISWFVYGSLQRSPVKVPAANRRSISWQSALRYWGVVFTIYCVMTALSPMMGWMFWASFGLALGIFRFPWVLLPVVMSILGVFYAIFVTERPPANAASWIVLSITIGSISIGYAMYSSSRVMRERIEREHAFVALEDVHRQLADAHYQLELSAERDAEMAVISERNRLTREMHDTTGQALVLIAVKLEAAQRLRAIQPERADIEIETVKEIVRATMGEMRDSLANIRMPMVMQHPIAEILARRTRESSERAGFHVTYRLQSDLENLSAPIREALYRITVEALTNIEKHAHAHSVTLSLSTRAESLMLEIADDGVGLAATANTGWRFSGASTGKAPSSPPGHYGITGMRERAEALNGQFIVDSCPGEGTIVKATIPLPMVGD